MSWKQFLKPDWKKIVLLILLILLVTFIPKYDKICSPPTPEENGDCSYIQIFGVGYPSFYGERFHGGDASVIEFSIEIFVLNIVIYYLLSCLIISAYDKLKVRKRSSEEKQS